MSGRVDREFLWLAVGVLAVLVAASIVGAVLARRVTRIQRERPSPTSTPASNRGGSCAPSLRSPC